MHIDISLGAIFYIKNKTRTSEVLQLVRGI